MFLFVPHVRNRCKTSHLRLVGIQPYPSRKTCDFGDGKCHPRPWQEVTPDPPDLPSNEAAMSGTVVLKMVAVRKACMDNTSSSAPACI